MQQSNIMSDLLVQIAATLIGGLLLAFVFFLIKDKLFRIPALAGLWTFSAITEKTSYNPFKSMTLTYLVLLVQEGNRLIGTGEKIKEVSSSGTREYEGQNRTRIQITGFITQRFLSKSECVIHISEAGERRESSTMHTLKVTRKGPLIGTYVSTVANQIGKVTWTRGNDSYSFSSAE